MAPKEGGFEEQTPGFLPFSPCSSGSFPNLRLSGSSRISAQHTVGPQEMLITRLDSQPVPSCDISPGLSSLPTQKFSVPGLAPHLVRNGQHWQGAGM